VPARPATDVFLTQGFARSAGSSRSTGFPRRWQPCALDTAGVREAAADIEQMLVVAGSQARRRWFGVLVIVVWVAALFWPVSRLVGIGIQAVDSAFAAWMVVAAGCIVLVFPGLLFFAKAPGDYARSVALSRALYTVTSSINLHDVAEAFIGEVESGHFPRLAVVAARKNPLSAAMNAASGDEV